MLSTLAAMQKQSSSTKEKIMRKSKTTVRHPITGTIRENDFATRQHLLLNQSSWQRTLLIRRTTQNASYTQKESIRPSNAALFAKHSEHLQLLQTKTTKRKSTRTIHPSNKEFSMPVTQKSHLLGLPPVLHPIKVRMGSPELWLNPKVTRTGNWVIYWAYPRSHTQ